MRKWIATATAAAVALATAAPALAQSHGFAQQFDDEAGATVSLNYRVPLGGRTRAEEPSYGVTLNWGHRDGVQGFDSGEFRPNFELADIRFNGHGLARTEIASINFTRNADGEFDDPRLNMMDGKDTTTWIIIGLVVTGAVVWAVAENDDDDDHHDD